MQIWGGKLENSFLSTLNFPDMIKIISQKETQKLKRQCKHGDWSYIKFYAKLAPFNETFINGIFLFTSNQWRFQCLRDTNDKCVYRMTFSRILKLKVCRYCMRYDSCPRLYSVNIILHRVSQIELLWMMMLDRQMLRLCRQVSD